MLVLLVVPGAVAHGHHVSLRLDNVSTRFAELSVQYLASC